MAQNTPPREQELEDLLRRLTSAAAPQWHGNTVDEIDRLERIAQRPLPALYRWFLMRMGQSMGPLRYPELDFSATTILSSYENGLVASDPRFLLIGRDTNADMPMHLFYDFEHSARDDARVVSMENIGDPVRNKFETFCEMIGWGKFLAHRVNAFPQRCTGVLMDEEGDVLPALDPLLKALSFKKPLVTGPCCGIYEASQAGMVTYRAPEDEIGIHFFCIGGLDAGGVRRILGAVGSDTALEVMVDEWEPQLAP